MPGRKLSRRVWLPPSRPELAVSHRGNCSGDVRGAHAAGGAATGAEAQKPGAQSLEASVTDRTREGRMERGTRTHTHGPSQSTWTPPTQADGREPCSTASDCRGSTRISPALPKAWLPIALHILPWGGALDSGDLVTEEAHSSPQGIEGILSPEAEIQEA